MSYTALYRKWRPAGFSDVKGQDHIVQTLKNQLPDVLDMPIYFAEPEELVKPALPRFLPGRLTVRIQKTVVPAGSARHAGISHLEPL